MTRTYRFRRISFLLGKDMKLRKGYVFTPVYHSVHRGRGVRPSARWDTPRQTPPQSDTRQVDTPYLNAFLLNFKLTCIEL